MAHHNADACNGHKKTAERGMCSQGNRPPSLTAQCGAAVTRHTLRIRVASPLSHLTRGRHVLRIRARQGYDWMINMEPKKTGLTPDDVLFIVIAVSLMLVSGAMTWLEWMKLDYSSSSLFISQLQQPRLIRLTP